TAPGAGVASAGGSAGGAAGPTTLAQIARALGLSQEALKATDWAKRLFAPETPTSAPQPSNQIAPDVPLAEGQPTMFDASAGPLTAADAALAAEAEGGAT